jgi:CBS domain-containing protein
VTDDGIHRGTIDLKADGTRIFVDAARALALAFGIAETGTAPRLRLAGRRLGLEERETGAFADAFHFLQLLRLRAQRGHVGGDGGPAPHAAPNRIDPYALNELDQRMLKEALRQARSLQKLLEQTLAR